MAEKEQLVKLYWNKHKQLVLSINDSECVLNPWIGVQIEEWLKNGKDWTRKEFSKHEPNDLLGYLERKGEYKPVKRNTAVLKGGGIKIRRKVNEVKTDKNKDA